MESPCKWYPLPVFAQLPPLLVSAYFDNDDLSYTIYVTDLANTWVEKLNKRGILLRSLQEETTIDLGDNDPRQWAMFMSKLKTAVDPTSSDHHLTSISIAAGDQSKNQDGLTLRTVCELPKPLNEFIWHFHLVKCQPSSLASELVLPLIQEQYVQRREAEDLIRRLKEKDALIKKLRDKLKAMNIPLESIFSSFSSKHAATRVANEDNIKGLTPFNQDIWRLEQSIESPQDVSSLFSSVFSDSGLNRKTGLDSGTSDMLNNWWQQLGADFRAASKPESSTTRQELHEQVSDNDISLEHIDDQAFEVRVSPTPSPPQSPTSGKSTGGKAKHETTESNESDLSDNDAKQSQTTMRPKIGTIGNSKMSSQRSTIQPPDEDNTASETEGESQFAPPKRTTQSTTRLGMIGRSKKSPQPMEAVTEKAKKNSTAEVDDETATESDSSSDSPQSSKVPPTTPRKGALGRIGGKSKATASSPETPQEPAPSTSGNPVPSKKTGVPKIGALGSKSHAESKRAHPDTPPEPEESESSSQRALRRREDLARNQTSETAHPVKKKKTRKY
ncbi:XRCC4-like factor-domain-containing protein [Xylaria flabelliformis]|nr:XRCC4-like factor-domain-containing protein [Xylaria flabelliformis]